MSCRATKDPDNIWYTWINWDNWFDGQIADIGGTFTLTAIAWFPDSALAEEGSKIDDATKKTYFYGSGGTDGTTYEILGRASYTSSTLGAQVFTEDRTISILIKEK